MFYCQGCSLFVDVSQAVIIGACGHQQCQNCSHQQLQEHRQLRCKICQKFQGLNNLVDSSKMTPSPKAIQDISDSLNNNDKTSSVMDDFSAIGWFGEDDDLLNEIDNILLNKRQRLEKVVIACDKLKQRALNWPELLCTLLEGDEVEYVRRMCTLPTEEAGLCRSKIDGIKKTFQTVTTKNLDDLSSAIVDIRQLATGIHDKVKKLYDLAVDFDEANLTFIMETSSKSRSCHKAECKTTYTPLDENYSSRMQLIGFIIQELHAQWYMREMERLEKTRDQNDNEIEKAKSPDAGFYHPFYSPPFLAQLILPNTGAIPKTTLKPDSMKLDKTLPNIATPTASKSVTPGAGAAKARPPTLSSVAETTRPTAPSSTPQSSSLARSPSRSPTSRATTVSTTPFQSWSQMAKQFCPPQAVTMSLPKMERTVAETNRPHCFLDVQVRKMPAKRVVIKLRPDKAPFMCENFIQLCLGSKGFGYKGSKIFRALPNNHVVGGDFEHNNGSGGYSAMDEAKLFLAEQCPLKDEKGAVRMKGIERTPDGRCKVGSQFMIWVGDIEFKIFKHTLVFGHIVEGLSYLQEISRIGTFLQGSNSWILNDDVFIINSGVL